MLKILRDRLWGIARDEEGSALVVTLAVFFFLYLMICGVYAVGVNVKKRIQLQNACDAAAYSAAVVQADTLSRIATLNRAMSWTYVQMTRRQMDYVAYKWLRHTYDHFNADRTVAEAWHAGSNPACPLGHGFQPNGWFVGTDDGAIDCVKLNGRHNEQYRTSILTACVNFNGIHLNLPGNRSSFYAVTGGVDFGQLGRQIDVDKATISAMNTAERDLAQKLKRKVENAVADILKANVPDRQADGCRYFVGQSENALIEENADSGFLRDLNDNDADELRFVGFGGKKGSSVADVFQQGINTWFVHGGAPRGIRRLYRQAGLTLSSAWSWWSAKWTCYYVPATRRTPGHWEHPHVYYPGVCPHQGCVDTCRKKGTRFSTTLYAGNLHDSRFDGAVARPLVMTPSYFGKAGTITVGLAMKNENPWAAVLGDNGLVRGLFSAFNPFGGCEWSWAFASAKAGYKRLGEDQNAALSRTYRIDWDSDQSWNLCQSDWDAVLVPVRCAESQAANGRWTIGDTSHLAKYVGDAWHWLGTAGSSGTWSRMQTGDDWLLESPGTPLLWKSLADKMLH